MKINVSLIIEDTQHIENNHQISNHAFCQQENRKKRKEKK